MHRLLSVILGALVLLCASTAWGAGVPQKINYQAVLLDDIGDPVTDMVDITFRIHDAAANGLVLWDQTINGIQPDDNGQFSVILGEEMDPITEDILTGEQRWLGIQVEGDPDEMSPRTEIVSSTYSFRVNTIDGAAAGIIYGPLTIEESLAKAADAQVIVACSAKSPYSVNISPCDGKVLQAIDNTDILGEWGISAPGQSYIAMTDFSAKAAGASVQIKAPSAGLPDAFSIANSNGDQTFQIESDDSIASVSFYYSAGVKASQLKTRVATEGFALYGATEGDEVLNIGEGSPGLATATWTDYSAKAAGASVQIKAPNAGLPDAFTIANSGGDATFQIESDPDVGASISFYSTAGVKASALKARVATEGFALFGSSESDEVLNIGEESPGLATATWTDYSAKAAGASVEIKAPSAGLPDAFTIANSNGDATFQIESDPADSGASISFYSTAAAKASRKGTEINQDGYFAFGATEDETTLAISGASIMLQPPAAKASDRVIIGSEGIYFLNAAKGQTTMVIHAEGSIKGKGKIAMGQNMGNDGDFANVFGFNNTATGDSATCAGGYDNSASGFASFVAGGVGNSAEGQWSFVAGAYCTTYLAATVGGGHRNAAKAVYAVVAGGKNNKVEGHGWSTVGGGEENLASSQYATVCGGRLNQAIGKYSTVLGGYRNEATSLNSCAAGYRAKSNHSGTFVWADGQIADFTSTAEKQFLIRANNGVGINVNNPGEDLDVLGTAKLRGIPTLVLGSYDNVVVTAGGKLWKRTNKSSKRYKEKIRKLGVDPARVLQMDPVRFAWKENGMEDVGLIAEDVAELIPELVIYDEENRPDGIKYDKVVIYLLAALKDLKAENDILKAQNDALKAHQIDTDAQLGQLTELVETILAKQENSKSGDGKLAIKQ